MFTEKALAKYDEKKKKEKSNNMAYPKQKKFQN